MYREKIGAVSFDRTGRLAAALAAGGVVMAVLAACSSAGDSVVEQDRLVIGVKPDQPALGLELPDGSFEGYDVDVARYVTGKLGYADSDVTFTGVVSADRIDALLDDDVDLVFATFSITQERKTRLTFGGPYYVAHQDTMVRADSDVRQGQVRDLSGHTLCQAQGSESWRRIIEQMSIDADGVEAPDYSTCFEMLADGRVDSVSTDDLILAGFATVADDPDDFRILGAPISDEKYGVGMRKGDLDTCEAVNRALTEMYQDGTAEELLDKWFGQTDGLELVPTVPQFEGCT